MLGFKLKRSLTGLFWIAVSAGAEAQATWHVDASATPPGNGTSSSPYASIQYAIDQATTFEGDALLVAPGTYYEGAHSGFKSLEIRSSHGPLVTLLISDPPGFAVHLSGWGFPALFEGFTVLTSQQGIETDGFATVRNCILVSTSPSPFTNGVDTYGASLLVQDCTIVGFGTAARVFPFACTGMAVENCLFFGNTEDLGFTGCNSAVARYCAFQKPPSSAWGVTHPVIHADLGLWSPSAQDFHLEPLSVCIDKGNPSAPPDPDGSIADIGAIPYDPAYAATPTSYCAGKVHSGGCAPRLSWSGTPSLSGPDDFVLQAHLALDGMVGKFIWGLAAKATPFGGGNLCIAPPISRGPLLSSGGSGVGTNCTGAFVWPVSHAYMQAQPWIPGQILYAQAWGRDPGSAFPEKSQLSDAVVFQVLP